MVTETCQKIICNFVVSILLADGLAPLRRLTDKFKYFAVDKMYLVPGALWMTCINFNLTMDM